MLTDESMLPAPFRVVACIADQFAADGKESKYAFYDTLFGLSANWGASVKKLIEARTCPTDPAELIPIGDFGVDGARAGIIVHAPEREQTDFPIGCYCEIDAEGVRFGGTDATRFIEARISECLHCWDVTGTDIEDMKSNGYHLPNRSVEEFAAKLRSDAAEKRILYTPAIEEICERLNIQPKSNARLIGWGGAYVEFPPPEIPKGWRYLNTSDHVGILAPEGFFDPGFSVDLTGPDCLLASRMLRRRGFPATALYLLKQNARDIWLDTPNVYPKLLKEMAEVYKALDRNVLAQSILQTLSAL